jgi:ribosome biogenesis GTPase
MSRSGLVIQHGANRYLVEEDGPGGERQPGNAAAEWPCTLRGKLRQGRRGTVALAVIGDHVRFSVEQESPERIAVIEEVLPRANKISRPQPSGTLRRSLEQIVMANVDRLWIVASLARPALNLRFVDRILAAAELQSVPAGILFNKSDLEDAVDPLPLARLYERLEYPVLVCSVQSKEGLSELARQLSRGIFAFVGLSGVGKSSLLQAIEPGLDLRVQSVQEKHGHGRHTTTNSRLYPLQSGAYLADTPGMREFGLWGVFRRELGEGFVEIRERAAECRFRDCLHMEEPQCAVRTTSESGEMDEGRYLSYRILLGELPIDALERDGILKAPRRR